MTEETAAYLLTQPGRTLLAQADALLAGRVDTLTALTRLRKTATPELALAAWEMADLRRRGAAKFGPDAAQTFFVREALEQASGLGTAAYHARRFVEAGTTTVSDLGGGIGGDALAFARAGLTVTLYERDPIRAKFAEENARALNLSGRITVVQADVTVSDLAPGAAWLDPARRQDKRRVWDPEDFSPPLSWLEELRTRGMSSVGIKLSPALDHALAANYGAELEFISESGECREALLWLGDAQSGERLRATILTPGGSHVISGEADDPRRLTVAAQGHWLYEPDPAVIRAHLVGTLAAQLNAAPVDPRIAYLLGDTLTPTPFATAYEVLERFPYGRKRLQEALTARDVGRVIIKKRGFPQEPDEVRKQLTLRGSAELIVVLARIGSSHEVFLCRMALESA